MAFEVFRPRRFQPQALKTIEQANQIIDEYQAQGFTLSLRQLHYQFVARDLYANTHKNYKQLGVIMLHARDAGLSDWDAIEDRTRDLVAPSSGKARQRSFAPPQPPTARTCGLVAKAIAARCGSRRMPWSA